MTTRSITYGWWDSGRICRFLLCAVVLSLLGPGARPGVVAAAEKAVPAKNAQDWRALLQQHAYDSAHAREAFLDGRQRYRDGDGAGATEAFERASDLDARFAAPHAFRARTLLREGRPSAAGEIWEALRRNFRGYRNQSRWASNVLLGMDMALLGALLWILLGLSIRYLPHVRHFLAQRVDTEHHLRGRLRWLWIPLLAIFALAWGVVPLLALTIPLVWIHAEKRTRALLGGILLFFAAQGATWGPFGALLVGTDPTSVPALVERAAYEAPTTALLKDIDRGLAARAGSDPDLLLARGLVHARRGDFELSNQAFLENLDRRAEDPISTNNIACNHFFLGNIDRAVAGFQRSVSLDSTRAVTHYNLGQAYMQKLFLRESGSSLRTALELGFTTADQHEPLPRGAVYFRRPSALQLWSLAWHKRASITPFDLLHDQTTWTGVPSGHVAAWLLATLLVSIGLSTFVRRDRRVFECVNCGQLACPLCRGEHEGAVLCRGCARTARRARSEMVLQTLLRNRRRDAESRYLTRISRLDRWGLGLGRVVDGVRGRGVVTALVLGACAAALLLGRAPLEDPWAPPHTEWWTLWRWFAVGVLLVLAMVNGLVEGPRRGRHLQPHPSSAVSLIGLIEGRAPSRVKRGVRA